MRRKQLYEVGVNVSQVWVFQVEAYSKDEAKKKARENHPDIDQICTTTGKGYVTCLGVVKKEKKDEPIQRLQSKKGKSKKV